MNRRTQSKRKDTPPPKKTSYCPANTIYICIIYKVIKSKKPKSTKIQLTYNNILIYINILKSIRKNQILRNRLIESSKFRKLQEATSLTAINEIFKFSHHFRLLLPITLFVWTHFRLPELTSSKLIHLEQQEAV